MDPKEILKDLFQADPGLKQHEPELIKIIDAYMKARPDTKFDQKFADELRSELMRKAEELKANKQAVKITFPIMLTRFAYALASATLVFVLAIGLYANLAGTPKSAQTVMDINFGAGVKVLGRNAFAMNIQPGNQGANTLAYGRGGGGGAAAEKSADASLAAPSAVQSSGTAESTVMMDSAKIMPPEFYTYKYVYNGEDFTQELATVDVYRRAVTSTGSRALADYITALNFDLFDLAKFSGSDMAYLTMNQDREFGYSLSMDFVNNQVSISPNYLKWPRPEMDCRDDACFRALQLTYDQIPPDDRIIAIADDFLAAYGLDKSVFGQPYIQKYWEYEIMRATDKNSVYIPNEVSVIYPFVIEGQNVYDDAGNPSGISVGVNIKYNKGSSIYSIMPQTYEKSNYDAITDREEIIKIAQRGGLYPSYYEGADNVKELELGAPTTALLRYYDYDPQDGKQSELYIPALVFPVKDIPADYPSWGKRAVVVPLAKTIYEKMGDRVGVPMPLIEPAPAEKPVSDTTAPETSAPSAGTEPASPAPDVTPMLREQIAQ